MAARSLKRPLLAVALATLALLAAAAIAMAFTAEMNWGPGDFVVAALLLFGSGALVVTAIRQVRNTGRRVAVVVAVALGLAVVWAELAVGLFH